MSVTLEKRRKVAELENFERRILKEKRRLLSELESLERPFRKAKARGRNRGFSSYIAGEWRALYGAASSRGPIWLYVVAAIVLLGGAGLVAHLAVSDAPPERALLASPRRVEPQPASAQPALATTSSAHAQDPFISSAMPAPDATALRERFRQAQSATEPLPEPLPPPVAKARTPEPAPVDEAAPVAAPDDAKPHAAVERAPSVDAAVSTSAAPAAVESQAEEKPANEGRHTQCLVKVDGQILFQRGCMLRQSGRSTLTFNAGDEAVVLTLERGRTWMARLGGRSLGKVYRTGECWGRRREVYICAKGA